MTLTHCLPIVLGLALAAAASTAACSSPPASSSAGSGDSPSTGGKNSNADGKKGGDGSGSETEPPTADGAKAECLPASEAAEGQGESEPNAAGEYLELEDDDLYTGFDGQHTFEMPTRVRLRGKPKAEGERDAKLPFATAPTFTVEDPSIVDVRPVTKASKKKQDVGQYLMVTAKKAGITKINVKYNDLTAFTVVHVQAYTTEQFETGKKRYEDPPNPSANRQACTSCHNSATGVTPGEQDNDDEAISHDPTELAYLPDEEIRVIATEGQSCEDGKKVPIPELARFGVHKWNFSQEELVGIVAYMRSLKPVGF